MTASRREAPSWEAQFLGPTLLLAFGAMALCFCFYELARMHRMPAPIEIGCTAEEIARVEDDEWVRVRSCDVALEHTVEIRETREAIPLLDPAHPDDGAVAVLLVRRIGDSDEAASGTVEGILDAPLDSAKLEGVRWKNDGIAIGGKRTIDPNEVPTPQQTWFLLAASVVVLGLGAWYLRRALRAGASARFTAPTTVAPTAVRPPDGYAPIAPPYSAAMPRRRGNPTIFDRGDDFNFVLLLGMASLAIVAVGVGQFVSGEPDRFPLWMLLLAVPLGFACAFGLVQQRGEDSFAAEVHHARAIGAFRLAYRGQEVDRDAEVVVFDVVASLLLITISFRSRPLVVGVDRIAPIRICAIAITILLGWWALPAGPMRTIVALVKAFRGGERRNLADLLADPEAVRQPLADT